MLEDPSKAADYIATMKPKYIADTMFAFDDSPTPIFHGMGFLLSPDRHYRGIAPGHAVDVGSLFTTEKVFEAPCKGMYKFEVHKIHWR